jgi:hypothetical protein
MQEHSLCPPCLFSLRFERSQTLHQATFTASGIIRMDHTLAGCMIEPANSLANSLGGCGGISGGNSLTGLPYLGARASAMDAIAKPCLLILPDALLGRINVCQAAPPKCNSKNLEHEIVTYDEGGCRDAAQFEIKCGSKDRGGGMGEKAMLGRTK